MSSVVCNTPWRAYSPGGGPVECRPVRAILCYVSCQVRAGQEDHTRPGWTTSIRGQDYPWKSQSERQRTEINGESTSMVWPTLGSRTAKEQTFQLTHVIYLVFVVFCLKTLMYAVLALTILIVRLYYGCCRFTVCSAATAARTPSLRSSPSWLSTLTSSSVASSTTSTASSMSRASTDTTTSVPLSNCRCSYRTRHCLRDYNPSHPATTACRGRTSSDRWPMRGQRTVPQHHTMYDE